MKSVISIVGFLGWLVLVGQAYGQQTTRYDLAKMLQQGELRTTTASQTAILPGDSRSAISSVNAVWFKNVPFDEGTINIDLRGGNVFLQSFLGIMFHRVDTTHFDFLFFRPFNFRSADTLRRHWSVQYMSMPDFPYDTLRNQHPLTYENKVQPAPDPNAWFHATILVTADSLKVWVNHASSPCLVVHLLNDWQQGGFGLFSDGLRSDFANLTITRSRRTQ